MPGLLAEEVSIEPSEEATKYPSLLQIATQRESQNTLEYPRLEYVIATQLNPRVVKAQTIRDAHLEYSLSSSCTAFSQAFKVN